jgi:chromate reductase
MKIIGILGSLRKQSYNRSLIQAVQSMTPEGATFEIVDIGTLPLFNQDDEMDRYPAVAQTLKDAIKTADGVIIVTPEYNRSIPGVLKNAIDWTSRPYGTSPWNKKHVAIMGASGGLIGTAVGQQHLKQIMVYLGARLMGQPEFYLNEVTKKLDANGVLTDEATKEHIAKFWAAFVDEINHQG